MKQIDFVYSDHDAGRRYITVLSPLQDVYAPLYPSGHVHFVQWTERPHPIEHPVPEAVMLWHPLRCRGGDDLLAPLYYKIVPQCIVGYNGTPDLWTLPPHIRYVWENIEDALYTVCNILLDWLLHMKRTHLTSESFYGLPRGFQYAGVGPTNDHMVDRVAPARHAFFMLAARCSLLIVFVSLGDPTMCEHTSGTLAHIPREDGAPDPRWVQLLLAADVPQALCRSILASPIADFSSWHEDWHLHQPYARSPSRTHPTPPTGKCSSLSRLGNPSDYCCSAP